MYCNTKLFTEFESLQFESVDSTESVLQFLNKGE
ncbi:uncharacterized protein METZ01_LOCUS298141, partial [marine metagenome]